MKIDIGAKIEITKGRDTGIQGIAVKVGTERISLKYGDVTRIDYTTDLSWTPGAEIIPGYVYATDASLIELSK
jgi:hypothetical protein